MYSLYIASMILVVLVEDTTGSSFSNKIPRLILKRKIALIGLAKAKDLTVFYKDSPDADRFFEHISSKYNVESKGAFYGLL